LADWLAQCGIKTVAMESTGVYWIPLYEILEEHGFARLHGLHEESSESLRSLNLAFLQRMDVLTVLMREILARLPTLPQ
jgi:hypothetical protein